ncbi:MAG: PilZ domain-containing protein [Candidatus Eremiobacteraeota bacterium]|nr:PilZ domain-containing protein [Candidatus Eremiobacteraeota bacterium]
MAWLSKLKEIVTKCREEDLILKERRRAPRISCFIEAAFSVGEYTFEGTIIALEATGLRLLSPVKLSRGDILTVKALTLPDETEGEGRHTVLLKAEIVWCRQKRGFPLFYAGAMFLEDEETIRNTWVYKELSRHGVASTGDAGRRRTVRVTSSLPVQVVLEKRKWLTGVAIDLSLGGIKMNLIRDPGIDKEVTLRIGPYKNLALMECRGIIKRSAYNKKTEDYTLGVEFINFEDTQVKQVGNYIMALLREARI